MFREELVIKELDKLGTERKKKRKKAGLIIQFLGNEKSWDNLNLKRETIQFFEKNWISFENLVSTFCTWTQTWYFDVWAIYVSENFSIINLNSIILLWNVMHQPKKCV